MSVSDSAFASVHSEGILIPVRSLLPVLRQAHLQAWNVISKQIRKQPLTKNELRNPDDAAWSLSTVSTFMADNACIDEQRYWAMKERQLFMRICQNSHLKISDSYIQMSRQLQMPCVLIVPDLQEHASWYQSALSVPVDTLPVFFYTDDEEKPAKLYQRALAAINRSMKDCWVILPDYADLDKLCEAGFEKFCVIHNGTARKTLRKENVCIEVFSDTEQAMDMLKKRTDGFC